MDVLYRAEVTEDQIDHLGHMNVMFYGAHAARGADVLLDRITPDDRRGPPLVESDRYTRHHREQLVGSHLEVRGGVIDETSSGLRLFEELVNADTQEVAATFILRLQADRWHAAGRPTVEVPDYGQPRSVPIDDDPTKNAPSLARLRERDLAIRQVRTLTDDETGNSHGASIGLVADLCWGGVPLDGRAYQEFHEGPGGVQIGWATMETRATWNRRPSAGDRVQSFEAEIDIGRKVMHSRHWVYDVDRGDLVCAFATVSLAFDPAQRRSVEIPDHIRRDFGVRLHPDLA